MKTKILIPVLIANSILSFTGCAQQENLLPPVTNTAPAEIQTENITEITAAADMEEQVAKTETQAVSSRDFSEMITVNGSEEFFALLREARDDLVPEMQLKITNYSDEFYDINNFEKGKYTLISKGKRWGNVAHMTYTFEYSESYAITRAIEEPRLMQRLSQHQQSTVTQLKNLQTSLVNDSMSDYEKELVLHDYLVKNYFYDTTATEDGEVRESATNISDFLNTHTGVCEAYAYTFKALCNMSGIECHVISGTLEGVGHAWNLVKIDGDYYHVDVTADDPLPDEPNHAFHTYFNLTDARIQRTHILDNKWYECNNTLYDYFVYNKLSVSNAGSFKALVERGLSEGKTTIVFRAQNYYVNDDDINSALMYKGFSSYVIAGDMNDPNGDFELRLSR